MTTLLAAPVNPLRFGSILPSVDQRGDLLLKRLQAGDDTAIGEVFDLYAPFVFGLAHRVTRNREMAEDVVQEVLTSLWCKPDRFDPERGSLRAYLGVQAHRRSVDFIRQEERRGAREGRSVEIVAEPGAEICDQQERESTFDVICQAIARLPFEQRQAVELAYFKGYTHRELASLLGLPEGTVKSRLRLAHMKLRNWLEPELLETT